MKHMTSFVLLLIFILMIPKVSSADFNYEIQRMRQKLNEPSDSHWAFRGIDYGPSGTFTGKICIMVGFVDTPNYKWSQSAREKAFEKIREAVEELQTQANDRRANVDIKWRYWEKISMPYEYSETDLTWYWWIMKEYFGVKNMRELQQGIKTRQGVKESPVIFLLKKHRDSDIISRTSGITWYSKRPSSWEEEFSCVFAGGGFTGKTFAHELLHQFGAVDYYNYNHEGVSSVAGEYFGRNLMKANGTYYIDDLTAYIIGWTNYLSNDAKNFLNETRGAR